MFDSCLVVGKLERMAQNETRLRKEDFRQRGDTFREHSRPLGKWSQQRVYLLFNMQAFSWASHLKHWILKMIVWLERVRGKVKARKPPR